MDPTLWSVTLCEGTLGTSQARSEPAKPWMDMERADLRMVESPSLSWAFPVLPLALAFQNFFRVR